MDLPQGCRLSIQSNPHWAEREFIDEALGQYNAQFLADSSYDYFGVFVRDEAADPREAGKIRAGLIGNCYAGWLFVALLWVEENLRRGGIGSALLAEAERRAMAFGCHSAWVDTFSFQGPLFYPRHGYREFARLDYPPGHERIFFRKQLAATPER